MHKLASVFTYNPGKRFLHQGYVILNAIYDVLGRKIIIASDDRNVEAVSVNLTKVLSNKSELKGYADSLLRRSFIIETNQQRCVIYYDEKDEDSTRKIQRILKTERVLRQFRMIFNVFKNKTLMKQTVTVRLIQRRIRTLFITMDCDSTRREFEIGRLRHDLRKFLMMNFQRFAIGGLVVDTTKMKQFLNTTTTFDMLDGNELEEELERMDEMAEYFMQDLDETTDDTSIQTVTLEYLRELTENAVKLINM